MEKIDCFFEKLTINTLELACKRKSILSACLKTKNLNNYRKSDYFLKNNIKKINLKKGTNIEIKLIVDESNYHHLIEKHYYYDNYVIICFENKIKYKNEQGCRVIDVNELKQLIDLYPIENKLFFDLLSKEIVMDNLSNDDYEYYKKIKKFFCGEITDEIIKMYNYKYLNKIKNYLTKKKINLFLGTGISLDFGVYSWNKLTESLVDYLNPIYIDDVDNVKRIIGNNNYSNTFLVKSIFPNYYKALYNCIYKKYTGIHSDDNTMRAVSIFLYKYSNTNVITYNYDEFLEKDIKLYVKHFIAISKYNGGKYPPLQSLNNIEINHVHGFIPYKLNHFDPIMKKSIILNQLDYFALYNSKKNWAYKIQYEALKKGISVFIGSSLSDIFLIKILNETKNSGMKFAFMCSENLDEKDKYSIIKYFNELNVRIIFCASFAEIHNLLISL